MSGSKRSTTTKGEAALYSVLERARVILDNMARENKPAIAFGWQRWPISHEPLRADAHNLLPDIDAALLSKGVVLPVVGSGSTSDLETRITGLESLLSDSEEENKRMREALIRLGSMEAFTVSRAIRKDDDNELIARIDFARATVGPHPTWTP